MTQGYHFDHLSSLILSELFFDNVLLGHGGPDYVLPLAIDLEFFFPELTEFTFTLFFFKGLFHAQKFWVGVVGWLLWGGVVVPHEILVTAPEAKFHFPILNLTWTGTWPRLVS